MEKIVYECDVPGCTNCSDQGTVHHFESEDFKLDLCAPCLEVILDPTVNCRFSILYKNIAKIQYALAWDTSFTKGREDFIR